MQNKPNLVRRRRIANPYNTKYYENKWWRKVRKNKPNSNPIKPNLKRAKMNINLTLTKDYRKKDDFAVRNNKPNSNPISAKPKMNANVFTKKDYENETTLKPKKTNPNKPNFKRGHLLIDRIKPKLLNFHHKNSLTIGTNSVKYRFLCNERECFYEKLYGKTRKRRA